MEIRTEKIEEAIKECCMIFQKMELTIDEIEIVTRSMNLAIEKKKGKEPKKMQIFSMTMAILAVILSIIGLYLRLC